MHNVVNILRFSLLLSLSYANAVFSAGAQTIPNPDKSAAIKNGKFISRTHCTRCHVVGDFNPYGGISSTPSFSLLVNYFDDWEERFLSFHLRRPHPAIIRFKGDEIDENNPPSSQPVLLEYSDIETIAAFARTLMKSDTNE